MIDIALSTTEKTIPIQSPPLLIKKNNFGHKNYILEDIISIKYEKHFMLASNGRNFATLI